MSHNPLLYIARIALFLLMLLGLLMGYYWAHKPINVMQLEALVRLILVGVSVSAMAWAAMGVGYRLMAALRLEGVGAVFRVMLAASLGLMLMSTTGTLLGFVGMFRAAVLWAIVGVLLILSLPLSRRMGRDVRAAWADLRPDTAWSVFLALMVAFLWLSALMMALAPPWGWDALAYQLHGPQRLLMAGRWQGHADNPYLGNPQAMNVLFAWAWGISGQVTAAATVHHIMGTLGLLGVMGASAKLATRTAAWLSAAITLSGLSVWLWMGWAYVDMGVYAMGAVALVALILWREDGRANWLAVMGLAVGYALSIKYTGGLLLIGVAVPVILAEPRRALPNALRAAIPALAVFALWMLHGATLYGHPLYPFGEGLAYDATRAALHSGMTLAERADFAWQFVLLPISATVFGVETGAPYMSDVGAWLLTLPFFLLIAWTWLPDASRAGVRVVLIAWAAMVLGWTVGAVANETLQQTRLMAAMLPMAGVLGGVTYAAITRMPPRPLRLYIILRGMITIALVLSLYQIWGIYTRFAPQNVALGMTDPAGYPPVMATYHEALDQIDALDAGAQVRFLWEPRAFPCPTAQTCLGDVLLDHWRYPIATGIDPADLFDHWRAQGDDYLLLNTERVPYFADSNPVLADWLATLDEALVTVWTNEAYTLYAWPG